jgi:phage repressor protein C with HTH and peptisase S24 domain
MILPTDPTPVARAQHSEVAVRVPWFVALVRGPSMAPTLRTGDAVLVLRTRRARPGDVVVARFRSRPGLLVVKRIEREIPEGWWLRGDNPFGTDDSRTYGPAEVVGRVVLRYWPRPRLVRRVHPSLGG